MLFTISCSVLATSFYQHKSHCDWLKTSLCYLWFVGAGVPSFHLFDESLSLDRDGFMCSMMLQDTDGTDATLTYPTVHLEVNTSLLNGHVCKRLSLFIHLNV